MCLAHADEKTRDSTGFGGPQEGSGRPPAPRAIDLLRERIEADIERVLDPLWEALLAESGVVVGSGEDATLETLPDHRTRIAAVREILDRGFGRPKQTAEISGPDGGPVEVQRRDLSRLSAEELRGAEELARKLEG